MAISPYAQDSVYDQQRELADADAGTNLDAPRPPGAPGLVEGWQNVIDHYTEPESAVDAAMTAAKSFDASFGGVPSAALKYLRAGLWWAEGAGNAALSALDGDPMTGPSSAFYTGAENAILDKPFKAYGEQVVRHLYPEASDNAAAGFGLALDMLSDPTNLSSMKGLPMLALGALPKAAAGLAKGEKLATKLFSMYKGDMSKGARAAVEETLRASGLVEAKEAKLLNTAAVRDILEDVASPKVQLERADADRARLHKLPGVTDWEKSLLNKLKYTELNTPEDVLKAVDTATARYAKAVKVVGDGAKTAAEKKTATAQLAVMELQYPNGPVKGLEDIFGETPAYTFKEKATGEAAARAHGAAATADALTELIILSAKNGNNTPVDAARLGTYIGAYGTLRAEALGGKGAKTSNPLSRLFTNTSLPLGVSSLPEYVHRAGTRVKSDTNLFAAVIDGIPEGADKRRGVQVMLNNVAAVAKGSELKGEFSSVLSPAVVDKLHYGYMAFMLSGTGTHVRNFTSSAAVLGVELAKSTGVGKHLGGSIAAQQVGERVNHIRVPSEVKAIADAFSTFAANNSGATKFAAPLTREAFTKLHETASMTPRLSNELLDKLPFAARASHFITQRLIGTPFGALGAADSVFKHIYYFNSVTDQALKEIGALKGIGALTTKELNEAVASYMVRPPQHISKKAMDYAENMTFQKPLPTGPIPEGADLAKKLEHWAGSALAGTSKTPLRWVIPFTKTPFNVVRAGIANSPFSRAYKLAFTDIRKDKSAKAMLYYAVPPLGITSLAVYLAGTDAVTSHVTGGMSDAPYVINTPLGGLSYKNIEPLRYTLGPIVDMAMAMRSRSWQESDAPAFINSVLAGLGGGYAAAFQDAAFFDVFSKVARQVIAAANEGFTEEGLQRLYSIAKGYARGPAILRTAGMAAERMGWSVIDPLKGDMELANEWFHVQVGQLPPRYYIDGTKVDGNAIDVVTGITVGNVPPIYNKLSAAGVALPRTPVRVNGHRLTFLQRSQFSKLIAQPGAGATTLAAALEAELELQRDTRAPSLIKQGNLESIINDRTQAATQMMMQAYPKLGVSTKELKLIEQVERRN